MRNKKSFHQLVTSNLSFQDRYVYDYILRTILNLKSVNKHDIFDKIRSQNVIFARHCLCYNLRKYTELSLSYIGRVVRKPPIHHTTVINSINQWGNLIDERFNGSENKNIQDKIEEKMIDYIANMPDDKKYYVDDIGANSLYDVADLLWKNHNIRFDFD